MKENVGHNVNGSKEGRHFGNGGLQYIFMVLKMAISQCMLFMDDIVSWGVGSGNKWKVRSMEINLGNT